jgi:hypothetical protein
MQRPLDRGIIAAHWLSADEIKTREQQLRSPLVLQSINDYVQGKRFPLNLLVDLD